IENILNTKIDFDILIATPDAMKDLSKVANILGPRGLMPNMKSGTITSDIINAIKEIKLGRIEYKSDSYGIIHSVIGKASFEESKLIDNLKFFIKTIIKSTSINSYLKTFYISSTMGPGILVDHKD
ncbi:MAG: 50S ribosomal protein L1, partial [Endomicrobium sp.]|nr:50S ribosomal protein L1 [Endomicrobium sp.]